MPTYSLKQLADMEETMYKQLQSMDLMESGRPSLDLLLGTPGCSTASFPRSSESPLHSQFAKPTKWGKLGLLGQRSVSMVETSSSPGATLGWPREDVQLSQSDISPAALNTRPSSPTSSASTLSSSSRYKTELCRSFTESGLCKYGGKCQFAHGLDELRDLKRHPKYKTELCRTFHTIGFCPYGIRCHFVHNGEEEEMRHPFSRSSLPPQPPLSSRSHRPLVRQSFSFAGFPSVPQHVLQPSYAVHPPPDHASSSPAPSSCPPPCADISDLLCHAFQELGLAFESSPAQQFQSPVEQGASADPRSPCLPSPDSGYFSCDLSPTIPSSLRRSPSASGVLSEPLRARSLSSPSLSDQDGSSSASSLCGSESCTGNNESNKRRLAVFSQLSVP